MLLPAIGVTMGVFLSEQIGTTEQWSPLCWLGVSLVLAMAAWGFGRAPIWCREGSAVLVFCAALALGLGRHQSFMRLPSDHIAHSLKAERTLTRISGIVVTAPIERIGTRRNPYLPLEPPVRTSFTLQARAAQTEARPRSISGLVLVHCAGLAPLVELGDEITITGWAYQPGPPRNPHQTDWSAIQRRNGIHAVLNCDGPQYIAVTARDESAFLSWQRRLRAAGRSLLLDPHVVSSADPAAGLLEAILLGQRSAVSAAMDDAFARTGVVHVLSVSGFHIGVLAGACWIALRYVFRRGNRSSIVAMLCCVLLYGYLAEPTAPVLRSLLMTACISVALLLRRSAALLNSVCVAAILTVLVRPSDVFTAGFQLSFLQVLALIVLFPPLYRRLTRQPDTTDETTLYRDVHTLRALAPRLALRWALALGLVSAISWLVAAPLIAFHFQMLAPWAMLQSMLLTPLFTVEIVLGVVTILIAALCPPAAPAFQQALLFSAKGLLAAVNWMAGWPATRIAVTAPPAALLLVVYCLMGLLLLRGRKTPPSATEKSGTPEWKRLVLAGLLCIVPLFAAGRVGCPVEPRPDVRLTVLSVGNGSAAWLDLPDQRTAVLDFGTMSNFDISSILVNSLRSRGIRAIDAVFLSHDDYDHFSGVPALLRETGIHRLVVNPQMSTAAAREWPVRDLLRQLENARVAVEEAHAPAEFSVGETTFQLIWPTASHPAEMTGNDASLVLLVKSRGRRLLFPGDIERKALGALSALHASGQVDLRCDVLLAPHHGAIDGRATRDFYAAAAPRFVIISTSRDRSALVSLLREILPDTRVFLTREVGAVIVVIDAQGGLTVTTPYAPPDAQQRQEEEESVVLPRGFEGD